MSLFCSYLEVLSTPNERRRVYQPMLGPWIMHPRCGAPNPRHCTRRCRRNACHDPRSCTELPLSVYCLGKVCRRVFIGHRGPYLIAITYPATTQNGQHTFVSLDLAELLECCLVAATAGERAFSSNQSGRVYSLPVCFLD